MDPFSAVEALSPHLREALVARGFSSLTSVQEAVLAPETEDRDLRISSKTGSGKTVALGFVIARSLFKAAAAAEGPTPTGPRALVLAPTRELAVQVHGELAWLLQGVGLHVVAVTGGTSIRNELTALAARPAVIVATPGRLLDHLERKRIDPSAVVCAVLDEADQMLDLGFREALESILGLLPESRRTHLVSATFSRDVLRLAQRYQDDATGVEGTRLGDANEDIAHVLHLCPFNARGSAVVNLLLMRPNEQALIFVRTRADTSALAGELADAGFAVAPLSGDMDQSERVRALTAFRNGTLKTLVATDVAARGIDVQDIARVIHVDPPGDAETYVHRSGRTGRAGKKGESVMLVPPAMQARAAMLLRRAKVEATWRPLPMPEDVLRAADERLVARLAVPRDEGAAHDARTLRLATRLLREIEPLTLVVHLLESSQHAGPTQPRTIAAPPPPSAARPAAARSTGGAARPFRDREALHPARGEGPRRPVDSSESPRPHPARSEGPRRPVDSSESPRRATAAPIDGARPPRESFAREREPFTRERAAHGAEQGFVGFRVTWGARHGADARRLLAILCRRGEIRGSDVGSIRIGPVASTFEVRADVAERFAAAATAPDARDPRVQILRLDGPTPASSPVKPKPARRIVPQGAPVTKKRAHEHR
jgi:ATP-dependent RNA helicase DeaD